MKKIAVSFCFLVLFSMLAFLPINSFNVGAEEVEPLADVIEISSVTDFNGITDMAGNYKITADLDFADVEIKPLGTALEPFTGTLNGGGNAIRNLSVAFDDNDDKSLGVVAYASGATIKNLSVDIDLILLPKEGSFKNLNIGGIVGYANGGTTVSNCKVQSKFSSLNFENATEVMATDSSINFGAIVGRGEGVSLNNSFAVVEMQFEQKGNELTESYLGGAVGKMDGGTIHNVYVAPTEETIASLTGVVADVENMKIETTLTNAVSFGGIVGYVSGRQFEMKNALFIGYLKTSNRVNYAGLIGKIHSNESLRPDPSKITTSKYLTVNETSMVTFSKAIGNAADVSFIPNSTLTQITTMPNNYSYFEDPANGWDNEKSWDFANTWRTSTIYSGAGIFLPDLQQFSELSIYLDYLNYSKYYTLNFKGQNSSTTFAKFKIGDVVEIEAKFNVDEEAGINYADFYEFNQWKKVGEEGFSANGKTTLSFVCSNQTAGRYYITTVGRPVKVNVSIQNEEGEEGLYGLVKYSGDTNMNNFSFVSKFASISDPSEDMVVKLEAVDYLSQEYVFSHFTSTEEGYMSQSKSVSFKLDNKENKPKVVPKDGELVCNIIAVFTNNTSVLNIKTTDNGKVEIVDFAESFSGEHSARVVNGKDYMLIATANEGYKFDGWYLGSEKISEEFMYSVKISEDSLIEAKFIEIVADEKGINIWIIIGPIIGAVVLAGIITLIVIKVKKNGANSYKKNYRY